MLTQERLKEILHYDTDTGVFSWKERLSKCVHLGDEAGSIGSAGYRYISIDNADYRAHRLAWLYVHGYLPESSLDHINRVRSDNRISNLREASRQCQARNSGKRSDNTSGITGVYWSKNEEKWVTHITLNGKCKGIGQHHDILEAAYHRYAAEQFLGFPDCAINSSAKKFIDRAKIRDDNRLDIWGPM